jgi:hypothetical protein
MNRRTLPLLLFLASAMFPLSLLARAVATPAVATVQPVPNPRSALLLGHRLHSAGGRNSLPARGALYRDDLYAHLPTSNSGQIEGSRCRSLDSSALPGCYQKISTPV